MRHRGIDTALWLVIVLVLAPVVLTLARLPFAQHLPPWLISVLGGSSLAWGAFAASRAPKSQASWWRWAAYGTSFVIAIPLAESGIAALLSGQFTLITVLLFTVTVALCVAVPWMVFARQPLMALVAGWLIVTGTANQYRPITWSLGSAHYALSLSVVLAELLLTSLILLGISYLRASVVLWDREHLPIINSVLWPAVRTITVIAVLVATVGLIPFEVQQVPLLAKLWKTTPLSQGGPLSYTDPNGAPTTVLGAPLSLDAIAPTTHKVILRYQLQIGAPTQLPLLLGATLDTYAHGGWLQGPVTLASKVGFVPTPGLVAQQVQARITLVAMPPSDGALLGFEQPVGFVGVTAHPIMLTVKDSTSLGLAGWKTTQSLDHLTYTTISAVLPDNVTPNGTLDPALQARMTALPTDANVSLLVQTANDWSGNKDAGASAQAQALLATYRTTMTIDAAAKPTGDPVAWCIAHHRGNVLLLTTTYVLLARALGLPMRLAEGYLSGSFEQSTNNYAVHEDDATVWAQLAIPGEGWLDLFPAANVLKVDVPPHEPGAGGATPVQVTIPSFPPAQPTALKPHPPLPLPQSLGQWLLVSFGLVALLFAIVAVFLMRWRQFGRFLPPIVQLFTRLALLARAANIPLRASDTPREATTKLTRYEQAHAQLLSQLNGLYEAQVYGPKERPLVLPDLAAAWQQISRTFWRLVLTRRVLSRSRERTK